MDTKEIRIRAEEVLTKVNDLFEEFRKETGHIIIVKHIDLKLEGGPYHYMYYLLDDIVVDVSEK